MNKALAVLPALTLLTCHSQELATSVQSGKSTVPVCAWSDARFLPKGDALRLPCSADQIQEVEKARTFIEDHRGRIAAALTARVLEFPFPSETYEVLSQKGSQASYYCTQEPLRLEAPSGTVLDEYVGVVLSYRTTRLDGRFLHFGRGGF